MHRGNDLVRESVLIVNMYLSHKVMKRLIRERYLKCCLESWVIAGNELWPHDSSTAVKIALTLSIHLINALPFQVAAILELIVKTYRTKSVDCWQCWDYQMMDFLTVKVTLLLIPKSIYWSLVIRIRSIIIMDLKMV